MAVVAGDMRSHIKAFDFTTLFIEDLHWDRYKGRGDVYATADDYIYTLTPVAQKSGVVAYVCDQDETGVVPTYAIRRKIEREVAKSVQEHIIIYIDAAKATQVWQWVWRQEGKPAVASEHAYYANQSGESLVQKLEALVISLDEEVTVLDVVRRVNDSLHKEKVTKRFYERFQKEHTVFLNFVKGITEKADREWYASLMLNRLMFVYFIQRKKFLDADPNYLRTRLGMVKREQKTPFLSFYKYFLLNLFQEGLSKKPVEREPHLRQLLGKIPYLNGGLFDVHTLESRHPNIDIPDEAFERIFDFFDAFGWHLDDRPLRSDNEINPDVLGYIFEKYINQKQMGAYYTKEDITEYISQNTIIPYLLEVAQQECAIAFEQGGYVWRTLQENPDRYIYEAVRKDVDAPLPADIDAGCSDTGTRAKWNQVAEPSYALTVTRNNGASVPLETWRECINRREHYGHVWQLLASGAIHSFTDLVRYNLDVRQFAQDIISNCEGPELLRACYKAIERIAILDPTCGSGAFNFAALNVLEPLYEACLARMQGFVEDADRIEVAQDALTQTSGLKKYDDFRHILAQVATHPNRRYFIYRSIIMNNLYGVDIMEEAVEICKLRLFLKLVSQVEDVKDIEPLPDIDFNIRAGNTLVGFSTYGEVQHVVLGDVQGKLDIGDMERIDAKAAQADHHFQGFRTLQSDHTATTASIKTAKAELYAALTELRDELDRYLAGEYGVKADDKSAFAVWRTTHQPFHWFVEFYGILKRGGFDVIIGNPPYVEYSKVRKTYRVKGYDTMDANNLLAFVAERCTRLSSPWTSIGLIIQLSAFSTPRMASVNTMATERGYNYVSFYECRPGKLFEGIDVRLAIWLRLTAAEQATTYATRLNRFASEYRPYLLPTLQYTDVSSAVSAFVTPKLSTAIERSIFDKIEQHSDISIGRIRVESGPYKAYYSYGVRYWARVLNVKPYYKSDTTGVSTGEKVLDFTDKYMRDAIVCVMTSSLFFWFYCVTSDGHNFTKTVIDLFPVGRLERVTVEELYGLCMKLMDCLDRGAVIRKAAYKTTGNIEYNEYDVSSAKAIIDDIDRVLAKHYGFTDNELDFIINYDIKYRVGGELEGLAEDVE